MGEIMPELNICAKARLRCLLIACPGVSLLSERHLLHVQNLRVYGGWPAPSWWALLPHP